MTPIKPLDLDALRKIAEAATRGPWWTGQHSLGARKIDVMSDGGWHMPKTEADAAHIAAFDPPTVLRLIELAREAEGLKRQRDVAMKFLRERPTAPHPVDQMNNLTKFLREDAEAEVAELTAERDALRVQLQTACEACKAQQTLIGKAQRILTEYLCGPPKGLTPDQCISALLSTFDGPVQRKCKAQVDAFLGSEP